MPLDARAAGEPLRELGGAFYRPRTRVVFEHGILYNIENIVPQEKEKNGKVQDAHEAIRPTYIDLAPADIKDSLSKDEYKLYSLIWRRFIACRMKSAIYDTERVTLDANSYTFTAFRENYYGLRAAFDNYTAEKPRCCNQRNRALDYFNIQILGDTVFGIVYYFGRSVGGF